MLTRWPAFTSFLDDGRICLSNNSAERALRGLALGRKSWLFAGSERGAERAALMYTLIQTAKLNNVDPQAWLADVLARIADTPQTQLAELLPWKWRPELLRNKSRLTAAYAGGYGDPTVLAGLRHPRLACPHEELIASLDGRLRDHHRFLIGQHLKTIEQIEATIAEFDVRLEVALAPFRDVIERLKGIPGVSDNVAQTLIAEVGADMSAFPTGDHLVSWAGMCPRLDESAGRKRSKRLRKGAPWLKPVLVQAALSATKVKSSSMRARYLSLKPRLGHKKAIIAVAAAMLRAVYHMLKDGTFYQDLGPGYRRPGIRSAPPTTLQNESERLGLSSN